MADVQHQIHALALMVGQDLHVKQVKKALRLFTQTISTLSAIMKAQVGTNMLPN